MSVETVQLFYGLLALLAWLIIGVLGAIRLLAVVSDGARDGWETVSDAIAPNALGLAWFVALLATTGSLYFSEVAGYVPCTLCWYQRIAMYPLVVILAVGAARRDGAAAVYALALAVIGALIAAVPLGPGVDPRPGHRRLQRDHAMHPRLVPGLRAHQPAQPGPDRLRPDPRHPADPCPPSRPSE